MLVSKIVMPIDITSEAPAEMSQLWVAGLQNKAEIIDQRRRARVADEEVFLNKIADPSEQGYQSYPNPTFISRHSLPAAAITVKQASNLKRTFGKYSDSWDYMFETVDGVPAKRFKEKVGRSQNAFSKGVAARTLPFTGFKKEGRGPSSIAGMWLIGDTLVLRELRSGDKVEKGGPFRICPLEKRSDLKTTLNQRIIQAGAWILRANLADTVLTLQNERTNSLVQGFVDPALGIDPFTTGGLSHVDFTKRNQQLFLEIQVSQA